MSHNEINHNRIKNLASDVLDQYGITHPVVDVFKIAKENGIQIKEVKMPEKYSYVAGFYEKDGKIIYLDEKDTPGRKLFTIAHELGHIFLGHKNYAVRFRVPKENTDYPIEESEANSFAAHLLIPEFMLREYLDKYRLDESDYVELAKIFGVPYQTMRNALSNLLGENSLFYERR